MRDQNLDDAAGISQRSVAAIESYCQRRRVSKLEMTRRLDVNKAALYHWECGKAPSSWALARICRVTGADPRVLLGLDTESEGGGLQS